MHAAAFLLLIAGLCGDVPSLSESMRPGEVVAPAGRYAGRRFRYRLFVPTPTYGGRRYPLILWLHGHSNSGDNNVTQLAHLSDIVFTTAERSECPFFLLAMQCPAEEPYWFVGGQSHGEGEQIDDMLDLTMYVVDRLLQSHPIDPDRITAVGPCSGGAGCWEMAARYGDRLAAAAPLASARIGSASARHIGSLPIWAFHSTRDLPEALAQERRIIAELQASGGNATLTEFDTSAHDCWTPAFRQKGLLRWLLSQRRGQKPPFLSSAGFIAVASSIRADLSNWTFTQLAIQAMYLSIFGLGVFTALRAIALLRTKRAIDQDTRGRAESP